MPLNPLHQLISSGITHASSRFVAVASELLIRMNRKFATEDRKLEGSFQLLPGSGDLRCNPFGELNMGLVEIDHAELRYSLFGHRAGAPRRVFRSHPIPCDSPRVR